METFAILASNCAAELLQSRNASPIFLSPMIIPAPAIIDSSSEIALPPLSPNFSLSSAAFIMASPYSLASCSDLLRESATFCSAEAVLFAELYNCSSACAASSKAAAFFLAAAVSDSKFCAFFSARLAASSLALAKRLACSVRSARTFVSSFEASVFSRTVKSSDLRFSCNSFATCAACLLASASLCASIAASLNFSASLENSLARALVADILPEVLASSFAKEVAVDVAVLAVRFMEESEFSNASATFCSDCAALFTESTSLSSA